MRTIVAHAEITDARQVSASHEGAIRGIGRWRIQLVPCTSYPRKLGRIDPGDAEEVHVRPVSGVGSQILRRTGRRGIQVQRHPRRLRVVSVAQAIL